MISIGIESTAHTFGVGIANGKGNLLANERSVYTPKKGWGIIPADAAKHHRESAEEVLQDALEASGLSKEDIGLISYARGPGLPPCLSAGHDFALSLSKRWKKPLIGVNHAIAHIEIGILSSGANDPVALYVSGGNTQVISHCSGRYGIMGEVLDQPIGNVLDTFARRANLQLPGGPKIEELAKKGKWIPLPYLVKGMDASFTGILTKASCMLREHRLEDICFSLQETCFSMLVEITERAMAHAGKDEALVAGGVASNSRLREMMTIMCEERGAKAFFPEKGLSGDNGAMIAWAGILYGRAGISGKGIDSRMRVDEVDASWKR